MLPTGTDPEPAARQAAVEDFELLRTVAGGVIRLSELGNAGAFELPYPPDAQRALDRIAARCMRLGQAPPKSVPDLMSWCANHPVTKWPLRLPEEAAGPGDRLVDPYTRTPTQLCYEWTVGTGDTAAELLERRLMLGAMQVCRDTNAPASYTALRALFVRRPVMTRAELALLHADLDLLPLIGIIEQAYGPAPAGSARDGRFALCAGCGCLLIPVGNDRWWCEQDRCRRDGAARVGAEYPGSADIRQLVRPLRLFVTAPGRAEIELEDRLRRLGLTVEMWPHYDAYDLRVTLPDGRVWALDVKDRANPALLGRTSVPFRTEPPFDSAFLVVPHYRVQDRRDYRQVFERNRPVDTSEVALLTDNEVVAKARHAVQAARRANDHLNTAEGTDDHA